jgi:hypothetical protein
LAARSWPIDSEKKLQPLRAMMAMNHGSTSRNIHSTPGSGLSRHSQSALRRHGQPAGRSRIASVAIVSAVNIRISGPFSKIPPASADQKIAGTAHPLSPPLSCSRWPR